MIDTAHYRQKLEKLKAETEAALSQASESSKPVTLDQTMVGRVSRIDAIQQQEMSLAAQRRRQEYLVKINAALQRIENGDFGFCIACDEKIAPARLDLDPTLPSCITCASKT